MKFKNFSANVQNAFEHDAATFECFSKLMLDTAKGKVSAEYSKEEANTVIRQKMFAILGVDEDCNRRELRKAIRRNKIAVYEVIEETLENLLVSGWGENPFFNEFVEVKNYNDGDRNEFYSEDQTILTVSELAGNHHDIIRQRLGFGEAFSLKTKWYGVKIYAEYELFMAGRLDWAKFVQKIYEAFDKHLNDAIYTALMSAGSELPNQPQFNKTAPLSADTKDDLITLIEDVQAATGKEVVIMGTKAALSKLTALSDVDWISESMKEERHTTGRLGIWEGTRLVEIPQVFAPNDTSKKLVDNAKLLIMPAADNRFIKVFNEGEMQVKEVSDGTTNMDMTIEYEVQNKMGIGVIIGLLFGVWTIEQ